MKAKSEFNQFELIVLQAVRESMMNQFQRSLTGEEELTAQGIAVVKADQILKKLVAIFY